MDYLYENLGDERFQEFCSCLVSKEFPNMQVFPVGQPDGGRDSLVYSMTSTKKDFVVFQVKYVRNPYQIKDIHKWLTETIEGEVDKINKLIPIGAKSYYLMTNVKGTAHLVAGSIDKLNKVLEEKINIPSICWWRDDLSRKLETDHTLKWSYPEIINGRDILNSALFNILNENKERRENVIRAYLADQYKIDNEVKFRQIDLQNRLLDLFIDVPIRVKKINEKNKSLRRTLESIENYQRKINVIDDSFAIEERANIGAAEFLLNPKVQNEIERILLEGGPGQGKSTISQYVCQVHRIRLLIKQSDLESIPDNIKNVPVRLPFKIDLRHIAAWVENKNPYQGTLSDEYFAKIWQKSLEAFLIAHIFYHSKLEDFSSSDFIAICKLSPILFVFDGFDEIANLKVREEIIDFINKGINRISVNSQSIQVLITSRPAAFSDSIGFTVDIYPHFELTDITPIITKEYVDKWIKANRLDSREGAEIRRLVEEKLEMPHLKDLAKSPMQLAIFISLLRTRGESLPNKRTALYDSYIELFFNRESEKSIIVRDHRDLIIDIHQYLAWVLHSEAEMYKNSGSIHIDDLKRRLKEYLQKEGHKTDIADKLFNVVKDRVCALVSRVLGTFEFEVQPLREYFCAKYLYKTSPYSPVGAEKSGTKPDRFEAISRNFYWQNVVRFFAGCFDKGELPMLIQKLRELQKDDLLKYTNYPRIITSQILSDWVFTQYPLLLKDVVKIIIDGINIGNILNQDGRISNNEPILLPNECGRTEVVIECFNQLKKFPASDYASELIGLIKNNPYKTLEYWRENVSEIEGEQLTIWLEYAYLLQIIHKMDEEILFDIVKKDSSQTKKKLQILIDGNRLDVIDKNIGLKEIVFQGILDSNMYVQQRKYSAHSLQFLTFCLNPYLLSSIFNNNEEINISFLNYIIRIMGHSSYERDIGKSILEFNVNDTVDTKIKEFLSSIKVALDSDVSNWRNNIEPWDVLVESGRVVFNDSWSLSIISVIAAGIKSKEEKFEEYADLYDTKQSLCKRVRCARMKSGNVKYWETQIQNSDQLNLTLLIFFTWATPKTISQLFPILSPIIDSLKPDEFLKLKNGIKKVVRNSIFTKAQQKFIEDEVKGKGVSNSIKYLLSIRFTDESRIPFIYEYINDYAVMFQDILEFKLVFVIKKFLAHPVDAVILNEIKDVYSKIKTYNEGYYYYSRFHGNESIKIPYEIAKTIMKNCKDYPSIISSLAEKSCRLYANKNLKPVGEIAKNDKWFEGN